MRMNRRAFMRWSAAAGVGAGAVACAPSGAPEATKTPAKAAGADEVPSSITALKPMTDGVTPIADEERLARIEKARKLMSDHRIDALVLEPGSSLFYYTGVKWGLSERPFVAVIPARGDIGYVCPGFEEMRAREQTKFSNDIRVWQEDDSPYKVVAAILKDRGAGSGRIGIEERARFFVVDGVAKELPAAKMVEAVPVTAGGRMISRRPRSR
jgi:Xaa-Pro dipeptidase